MREFLCVRAHSYGSSACALARNACLGIRIHALMYVAWQRSQSEGWAPENACGMFDHSLFIAFAFHLFCVLLYESPRRLSG